MKIVYVLEVDPYLHSGIIKKVNDQINFWRTKGNEVILLVIWATPKEDHISYIQGKILSSKIANKLKGGFIKNYLNKILSVKNLSTELEKINPDILYIRQNIWYPKLSKVLQKYNTVLEINTVDTIEINYYSRLKKLVYLFGREKIIRSSKGLVAVSPDILSHYDKYDIQSIVVSNGINLSKISKIKNSTSLGRVNLVFVGSSNMKWHGIDRIIELANFFTEYNFDIVGYDKDDFPNTPKNVKFYGWVDKNELEKIYAKNHFGLGSFSNHLVGKKVDSTLKVREYLAYGLPVILGHVDVDLNEEDFVFKATNEKGNFIDFEKIKTYIEKNRDLIVENKDLKIIESSTKEEERLEFFNTIYNK
ncbi:glycosyltransferase family 4 protein [Aquimarina sp. RZ0]|uniref:glycosyltransferase family 4 protein n=1 Tax=Aquimarina sp. RZ0 TaxID=2607730 RepID=UPI0011F301DE|nr:glycosyltransferase family 4 protein [Aquimarina sp. RZ0]KAA1244326.1 glycosyltransferase family 4 protein [Aquimarina sp. RZ0]